MCNVYLESAPKLSYTTKNLLTALGALDPDNTNLIHFNVENYKYRLPHKLAFQIITKVVEKKFFRTVLDEGASTSVLSLSCWKAIDYPELVMITYNSKSL